jgi:glutamate 5-kinase
MDCIVIKLGTSSLTNADGSIDESKVAGVVAQVRELRDQNLNVVLIASGAIAVGLNHLGYNLEKINKRSVKIKKILSTCSGIGQPILFNKFKQSFGESSINTAQVLLTAHSFFDREEYLHLRETISAMLENGVVPIINENDCVSSSSLRYGDNDLIAALTGHLISAKTLLLLTDVDGLYDGNPFNIDAKLVEEIDFLTNDFLKMVSTSSSSSRGSGGMEGKLKAAKIASWSNLITIIANSFEENIILKAVLDQNVGTTVLPQKEVLSSKKLWIGFVQNSVGKVTIDPGAEKAVLGGKSSLLFAGVKSVEGDFVKGDGIEVANSEGKVIAKGLSDCAFSEKDFKNKEKLIKRNKIVIRKDYLVILPSSKDQTQLSRREG